VQQALAQYGKNSKAGSRLPVPAPVKRPSNVAGGAAVPLCHNNNAKPPSSSGNNQKSGGKFVQKISRKHLSGDGFGSAYVYRLVETYGVLRQQFGRR